MIDLEGTLSVGEISGGEGTTNYNDLGNKPQINGIELRGNKSSQDFGIQDTLVSGTNIKTINNQSILGSGNITIEGGSGEGLSTEVKNAILDCFENVAWTSANGHEYYNALSNLFFPPKTLVSISAVFNQGSAVIYSTDTLDSLKQYLTVTATYDDSTTEAITNYSLSGTLSVGTSTITVSYGEKTDTFTVIVSQPVELSSISVAYTQSSTVYTTDTLDSLKNDLVVTANYTDSSTRTVTDYTLSGSLTTGTSTITVSYGGKTTTFNVTVTAVVATSIDAVFNQGSATIYDDATLDSLKQYLTVTVNYNNGTTQTVASSSYTLSGTLIEGTSTITVTYQGLTDTFDVTVTAQIVLDLQFEDGKALGTVNNRAYRLNTAARATTPEPFVNNNYTFTVTDSSKYAVNVIGVTDNTHITMGQSIDGWGVAKDNTSVAWENSATRTTPYVWVALKKNDGTSFTAEELANNASAVITITRG